MYVKKVEFALKSGVGLRRVLHRLGCRESAHKADAHESTRPIQVGRSCMRMGISVQKNLYIHPCCTSKTKKGSREGKSVGENRTHAPAGRR